DGVVPVLAEQRVVAGSAVDRVVAGTALQAVARGVAGDGVGEGAADRVLHVGERVAPHAGPGRGREVHGDRARRGRVAHGVGTRTALEVVVAVAGHER